MNTAVLSKHSTTDDPKVNVKHGSLTNLLMKIKRDLRLDFSNQKSTEN